MNNMKFRAENVLMLIDLIRELEYIMPDEIVKLVYTKQIYNEEEKKGKKNASRNNNN